MGVQDLAVLPEGQIVGVSLSTRASTTFRLGRNVSFFITARPEALFYAQGEAKDSGAQGGWTYNYTHVARLDLQTEQVVAAREDIPKFSVRKFAILNLATAWPASGRHH